MKIKPAVKLDLGEMCKLRLLFFVSREICIPIEKLHIKIQHNTHMTNK
jgi:hypothetical protein